MTTANPKDKIIIRIDPGTNVMGYGILGVRGKQPYLIALGVIRLSKLEDHYLRLRRIYDRVLELCPVRIKLEGESRRTQNAQQRLAVANDLLKPSVRT